MIFASPDGTTTAAVVAGVVTAVVAGRGKGCLFPWALLSHVTQGSTCPATRSLALHYHQNFLLTADQYVRNFNEIFPVHCHRYLHIADYYAGLAPEDFYLVYLSKLRKNAPILSEQISTGTP